MKQVADKKLQDACNVFLQHWMHKVQESGEPISDFHLNAASAIRGDDREAIATYEITFELKSFEPCPHK